MIMADETKKFSNRELMKTVKFTPISAEEMLTRQDDYFWYVP